MGVLDDFIDVVRIGTKTAVERFPGFEPIRQADDVNDAIKGGADTAEDLIVEPFEQIIDEVEDDVLERLNEVGQLKPENIEDAVDEAEGTALFAALEGIGATVAAEVAGAGQIESQQVLVSQILSFLALEDVVGTKTQATFEEGVLPAMEARVAKKHRSKFVDLPDAVEYALRNKQGDELFLSPQNAPQDVIDTIGSDEPVNGNNLVEEWGIRDDNLQILEEVALANIEFEELIETPAELGKIVPDDILEAELDRAGYAEDTKEFLASVNNEISRSNRVWEEKTAVEALVSQLDTLADDGELSPAEAVELLPEEASDAREALLDRFENIQGVPAGAPTRSLVEKAFSQGYTDLATLQNRLDRLEFDVDSYEGVLRTVVRDEIDGALQQSFALGFISEAQYGEYMDFVGLDSETQQALFAGQDLDAVAKSRLQDSASTTDRPVSALPGIGESRATALQTVDIETIADMAGADVETVADAAQISPETAEELIQLASQASG